MKLLKVDTIEEVMAKLKAYFASADDTGTGEPGTSEEIPLYEAEGRYLAEEIYAAEDAPAFTRSVVDGYAVQARDTFGVSDSMPVFFSLAGEMEMGASRVTLTGPAAQEAEAFVLRQGQAVYVPTGGMLPAGADAVVMVEFVEKLDEHTISVYKAVAPGSGLMERGADFSAGQRIYERGHRITVKDVGMLAVMGRGFVPVFARPRVSVISTGDEIVSVFEDPAPGQVRDVNSYTLAALVAGTGAEVERVALVRDDRQALELAFQEALNRSDIVLLSGGSSAGTKDMTAEIINSAGRPGVITHGIAMKPGKPTIVGVLREEKCCCQSRPKLAVGLPGHPMAAIIAYRVVVDAFIRKYYFRNESPETVITARLAENIHAGEGRETFIFVKLRRTEEAGESVWAAEPIHAKSASLSQLRYADGYVRLSHLAEGAAAGTPAEVTLLI